MSSKLSSHCRGLALAAFVSSTLISANPVFAQEKILSSENKPDAANCEIEFADGTQVAVASNDSSFSLYLNGELYQQLLLGEGRLVFTLDGKDVLGALPKLDPQINYDTNGLEVSVDVENFGKTFDGSTLGVGVLLPGGYLTATHVVDGECAGGVCANTGYQPVSNTQKITGTKTFRRNGLNQVLDPAAKADAAQEAAGQLTSPAGGAVVLCGGTCTGTKTCKEKGLQSPPPWTNPAPAADVSIVCGRLRFGPGLDPMGEADCHYEITFPNTGGRREIRGDCDCLQ